MFAAKSFRGYALRALPRFSRPALYHRYRFIPPQLLDHVEDIEEYLPGGFHPIYIGDVFDQGRFRILHKLGYGDSSTVWLARDRRQGEHKGRIVALKALRADAFPTHWSPSAIPELMIPQKLGASSESAHLQTVDHHFFVRGPNGSHLFLIFPLAGATILGMADSSPGRVAGSRRLRGDLAKTVAKQTATAILHMHNAGIVHGSLTTSNIMFRLSPEVVEWSDAQVHCHLGDPETEDIRSNTEQPPDHHAPTMVVDAIRNANISNPAFLQENIVVGDFGMSYIAASPPPSYEPWTSVSYMPPEIRFESRAGFEADVWSLGCAIFEMRAGFALFESFCGSDVTYKMVEMLGRLPDPWWGAFEERSLWFEENGEPKSEQDGEPESEEDEDADLFVPACKTSIRAKVLKIGERYDLVPPYDDGPMIERQGTRLPDDEVELLTDLLGKMLKYRPEKRICMHDVIRHPWFML